MNDEIDDLEELADHPFYRSLIDLVRTWDVPQWVTLMVLLGGVCLIVEIALAISAERLRAQEQIISYFLLWDTVLYILMGFGAVSGATGLLGFLVLRLQKMGGENMDRGYAVASIVLGIGGSIAFAATLIGLILT